MGGTSCDVSLIVGGAAAVGSGREVGGRALALPMVDVHTVGAGGGSIAWRDAGGALRVGPRSAGADPGPACYGRGGERPTVTDANLLLGHLDEDSPLAGGVRLDRAAAERAVGELADELGLRLDETAAGIARVASAAMAQAVRVVTVERGIDPRELALVAVRRRRARCTRPRSPTSWACGGCWCPWRAACCRPSGWWWRSGGATWLRACCSRATSSRRKAWPRWSSGSPRAAARSCASRAELRATYDLRYEGQAFELQIAGDPAPDPEDLRRAFDRAHEERYGYADRDAGLELVSVRVAVALPGAEPRPAAWDGLPGGVAEGPAVVRLPGSTLVVPQGWRAREQDDTVVMER